MTATKKISLDFGGMSRKQVQEMAAGTLEKGGFEVPPRHAPVTQGVAEGFNSIPRTSPEQYASQKNNVPKPAAVTFSDCDI